MNGCKWCYQVTEYYSNKYMPATKEISQLVFKLQTIVSHCCNFLSEKQSKFERIYGYNC